MSGGKESQLLPQRREGLPPPAAHLKKLLPESEIVYTGLDKCPQCDGAGYDSSVHQSACCSCSGLGEVFQCIGQPFDYREQREAVEALKTLAEAISDKARPAQTLSSRVLSHTLTFLESSSFWKGGV